MSDSTYLIAADLTLALHAAFIAFVVGGQGFVLAGWLRGWGWTRRRGFRLAHLGAIGFVVAQTWLGLLCPLTVLESRLRALGGGSPYSSTFIGHWLQRLIYFDVSAWVFTALYTTFGALVVVSYLAYPPRKARRDAAGTTPVEKA